MKRLTNKISSKAKIMAATRSLLNGKAMDEISIREIAGMAGVNLAMVNYYFSSKDMLFTAVLDELIIEKQGEWLSEHFSDTKPKRSMLIAYLLFLHEACVDAGGFAKTRVLSLLKAGEVNEANMKIYDTLLIIVKSLQPGANEQLLKLRITLAFASMISLSCSVKEVDEFNNYELSTESGLKKYVNGIAAIIFPKHTLIYENDKE